MYGFCGVSYIKNFLFLLSKHLFLKHFSFVLLKKFRVLLHLTQYDFASLQIDFHISDITL